MLQQYSTSTINSAKFYYISTSLHLVWVSFFSETLLVQIKSFCTEEAVTKTDKKEKKPFQDPHEVAYIWKITMTKV